MSKQFDPLPLITFRVGADHVRADGPWLRVREGLLSPGKRSGWKLHISATPVGYEHTLQRALPIIIAANVPFKLLRSIDHLEENLDGRHGLTQVGKAVTIYPPEEHAAAALAQALAEALAGCSGVPIPTDFPFAEDAPVYFRFGAFDNRYTVDPLGRARRLLLHPTAGEVVDATDGGNTPPPPSEAWPHREPPDHLAWLRQSYMPVKLLQLSPKGATCLALPLGGANRALVLLKSARAGAHADRFGRDALWALEHEHNMIQRLQDLPGFPPPGHILHHEQYAAALVRPFLEGETLWSRWTQPQARSIPDRRALAAVLARLASCVERAHQRGIVLRDLSTGNIVIHGGEPIIVDLELAHDIQCSDPPYRRGTAGFYDPRRDRFAHPGFADDHYALLALAWLVHTGVHPAMLHASQESWPGTRTAAGTFARTWKHATAERGRPGFAAAYNALLNSLADDSDLALCIATSIQASDDAKAETAQLLPPAREHTHQCTAGAAFGAIAQRMMDRALADPANPEVYNYYDGIAGLVDTAAALRQPLPPEIETLWPDPALRAAEAMTHVSGLYFGAPGIALAAMRDGVARQDSRLISRARDLFLRAAAQAGAVPDLCQGLAGLAFAALEAAQAAQCADTRRLSLDTGHRLRALSRPFQEPSGASHADTPLLWPWPEGDYGTLSGARLYGYAHGVAGVVWVLLRLWQAHGEDTFRTAAIAGIETLHRTALPLDGEACWWPPDGEDTTCWNAWCHGTPGVAKCLSLAVACFQRPQDQALLQRALRGIALANNGGFCLCHGIASRLDAYCDALPLLQGPPREEIYAAARHDANTLASLDLDNLQGPSGEPALGLMTGPLGILRTLHRWQALPLQ